MKQSDPTDTKKYIFILLYAFFFFWNPEQIKVLLPFFLSLFQSIISTKLLNVNI